MDLLNKIGPFYAGLGGLGDYLIFLSTFYDKVEKTNVLWFADDKNLISNFPAFNKIENTLVFSDKMLFMEYAKNPGCLGTGITPKTLRYDEWNNVNIFEKYGVVEFPSFVNEIEMIKANPENQVGVMLSGKTTPGKKKIITESTMEKLNEELFDKDVYVFGKPEDIPSYTPAHWIQGTAQMDMKKQLQWIKGMDKFYSVDSWCKTWSAMCGIETVVYDNVYEEWYLQNMGGKDFGHFVFIDPWSKVEFRKQ